MNTIVVEPWDVSAAMCDVMLEMLRIHEHDGTADAATIKRWHTWLQKAAMAHMALATSCEDVVESSATPENLQAMEHALATAMGQARYWARADRW